MKRRKSAILLVLLSVVILPLFTGCFGVGEDDPFISFRSRKSRVTGNWDVSKYYKNVKQSFGTEENQVILRVITDTDNENFLETTSILGTDSIAEKEGVILQHKMTFDKNGNFSSVYEYETVEKVTDENTLATTTTTITYKDVTDGTWNFLAGIDDYSNKERLALVIVNNRIKIETVTEVAEDGEEEAPTQTTSIESWAYNYANGEMSVIWEIDMLKHKEIHLYQNINNFTQSTDSAVGEAYTEVGYQQKNLVLEGKNKSEDEE